QPFQMNSQPDLTIRWEIEEIDQMVAGSVKESPVYTAAGLLWKIVAKKEVGCFNVDLHCALENEQTNWNCDVKVDAIAFEEAGSRCSRNEKLMASRASTSPYFAFTDEILLPEHGFCKDGKVTVEFILSINRVTGVREIKVPDFSAPDRLSNVILVVEGKKLHLSREFLAVHSPVFSAMFFGDFAEKNKEEIELKDVKYEEFVDLLYVIYPTEKQITASNAGHILALADQFDMKSALKRVEAYFVGTSQFERTTKLQIADQFKLSELRDHCLDSFKSFREIGVLKTTPEYKTFSNDMKAAICDRFMDFC
ncbi:hypothetical protein PFISCL1PPCAC_20939, partial [Pristionchus fissidentatus]